MKIAVVGAAGMVGSRVVNEAARRGHGLIAILRKNRKKRSAALPTGATAFEGDANDPGHMSRLFNGTDAIVAATRPAPGHEDTLVATTTALLDAAATARTRILVVGGAAPCGSRDTPAGSLSTARSTCRQPRTTTTLITGADGTSRISAEDLAVAVLDELEAPRADSHFAVGY